MHVKYKYFHYLISVCFLVDPPGKPEPMDVTKNSVSLVWSRPKHDGGSKLLGYFVEYTKLPEEKWTRCNANCMNIQTENYVVTGLEEYQQYQFRVIAKTAINISLPSSLSDPIPVIAENGTNSAQPGELRHTNTLQYKYS